MKSYEIYIWLSYGFAFLCLGVLVLVSFLEMIKLEKKKNSNEA